MKKLNMNLGSSKNPQNLNDHAEHRYLSGALMKKLLLSCFIIVLTCSSFTKKAVRYQDLVVYQTVGNHFYDLNGDVYADWIIEIHDENGPAAISGLNVNYKILRHHWSIGYTHYGPYQESSTTWFDNNPYPNAYHGHLLTGQTLIYDAASSISWDFYIVNGTGYTLP